MFCLQVLEMVQVTFVSSGLSEGGFFTPHFLCSFKNKSHQVRLQALEELQLPLPREELSAPVSASRLPGAQAPSPILTRCSLFVVLVFVVSLWGWFVCLFFIVAWPVAPVMLRNGTCGCPDVCGTCCGCQPLCRTCVPRLRMWSLCVSPDTLWFHAG